MFDRFRKLLKSPRIKSILGSLVLGLAVATPHLVKNIEQQKKLQEQFRNVHIDIDKLKSIKSKPEPTLVTTKRIACEGGDDYVKCINVLVDNYNEVCVDEELSGCRSFHDMIQDMKHKYSSCSPGCVYSYDNPPAYYRERFAGSSQ